MCPNTTHLACAPSAPPQAMQPPPAAITVDKMDVKKALAVIMAMDSGKAADIMMEMGAPAAATKLMAMDQEARHSILESMAPRAAAHALTKMEDLMQIMQEQVGQGARGHGRCAA